MRVLVIAEIGGGVKNATLQTLDAALKIGAPVSLLALASDASAHARIAGVERVMAVDGAAYAHGLAEPWALLVAGMADQFTHIFAPATAFGKNLLPRLAAALDIQPLSDICGIEAPDVFVRPIYAGNALATIRNAERIKIATVRGSAFNAVAAEGGAAGVESVTAGEDPGVSRFVSQALSVSERPELSAAKIVISGGRGMQAGENFAMLEKIADRLGAAVGASRAAVDAGYAANDMQVGQTGKIVAPELYIAVGISGAIQHLAGMKDSKVIVAINKDPEAPIFQVADYGLVADLFKAVPELDVALAG